MGACISCQSNRVKKVYGQRILTKKEIRNFILESEKYQNRDTVSNTIKSDKSCPDLIPNFAKLQINESPEYNTDEFTTSSDPECAAFEYKENCDSVTQLDASSLTAKGPKRPIDEEETSYLKEISDKRLKIDDESFIYNPLTADDVLEVLSNTATSSDPSNFSPLSLTSSSDFPRSNEENQQFNQDYSNLNEEISYNYLETIPEITSNTEEQLIQPIIQNDELIRCERRITQPRHSHRAVSSSIVEVVLNNVPSKYEVIKNRKKSGRFWKSYHQPRQSKHDRMLMESYDLPRENMLTFLFQKNEISQNIIHLMVLNNDLVNIQTVLECLQELQILRRYIDALDKRANPPISYAVSQGNIEMVECLLKYQAVLPSIIYSTYDKSWTPMLHLAFRFSFMQNCNNTSFKSSLLFIICENLVNLDNGKLLCEFLDTKDSNGLTLLHQMILQYYPPGISDNEHYPSQMIRYIIQLGANPEIKCVCPTQFDLKVDAVGQAIFSIHPRYTVELLLTAPQLKSANIEDRYLLRDHQYTLLEIIDLRQGIDLPTKQAIRRIILEYFTY